MSTKRKKRITKQIRIEADVHTGLRVKARIKRTTVSKLASNLCRPYVLPLGKRT